MDKAGKEYWNNTWEKNIIGSGIDLNDHSISNHINIQFHNLFSELFTSLQPELKNLVEIGCARSLWLPYFLKNFGFAVHGIDYSESGCEQAKAILENEEVEGKIICADFFHPSENMLEYYDVLVSFGVVEHFDNTSDCLSAFSRFLKPGGIIITVIPNMVGIIGFIQKIINKPVYDIHKLIDQELLYNAHNKAGFNVIKCHYFLSVNFGVLNLNGLKEKTFSWYSRKLFIALLNRFSMVIWLLEKKTKIISPTKYFSPYIICFGQKPFK